MNLIKSSLKYPQVSLVTILLIFLAGFYSLMTMPRRSEPKITIREALVIALYPGATAQQVQEQVTQVIEDKLFTYSEVLKDETVSDTRDGLVVVTVNLQNWVKDPDEFWERLGQGLFELSEMGLPEGVIGPLVDSDFGDVVALLIAVESDRRTYSELKDFIDQIENNLRQIPALSKIDQLGYQAEEIEVAFDSEKLAQFDVDLQYLIEILKSQNTIKYSGYIESDQSKVSLFTTGLFSNIEEIEELIIGASPKGSLIRIKDIARVERKLEDPTSMIRVNGSNNKLMLISLQMQAHYNIVDFGEEVDEVLSETKKMLPSDIKLTTINNQPLVVKDAVNDFMREFFIAVGAVILVIMILLPFNIALIASFSIPISIGMTFSVLNLFGFELQQVSLASLIVVLGMVVDNAVVIIDNYIGKLDEGLSRFEAAWRSATEFSIPLFSSTLAIIMAFLPLVWMLSGATGEFLFTLPITITIAMTCSLIVAFLLIPFFAYLFIKKGLIKKEPKKKRKINFSMLGIIQYIFEHAISWAMKRRVAMIIISLVIILLSVFMMALPKQQFFPPAERNQFVIQLFEPFGTKFDFTYADVLKIEEVLSKDTNITAFASFTGTSAPRVYYSFSPVFPGESYAMFLVNTKSVKATRVLADYYENLLIDFLPNANIDVMQFQSGDPVTSPVEVRIFGNNIDELKSIGATVKEIFRNADGSRLIVQDFEDNYNLVVNIDDEIANQLGFTTEIIADILAAGFHGAPLSVLWEGDDPINIVFRLKKDLRENFSDISNTYIKSPITNKSIPLRQIAELAPRWQTGKITRRNGIPTLTIGCKALPGHLDSEVLAQIQPRIDTLSLPGGYTMEYGGNIKNQNDTFGDMVTALIISLIIIFIILLFEFQSVTKPLIIMVSIPLTLFGSMLGLVATGNVFSFTAFVGLIALVGIVIRNALIIVDYADELVRSEKLNFHEAALESAKRRLRPIFLTTMAAAIGVVPMIVMKDPLWAPLASVFSFGIVFSMILTLMVTPVLYSMFIRERKLIGD